jgi:hypothetical protein
LFHCFVIEQRVAVLQLPVVWFILSVVSLVFAGMAGPARANGNDLCMYAGTLSVEGINSGTQIGVVAGKTYLIKISYTVSVVNSREDVKPGSCSHAQMLPSASLLKVTKGTESFVFTEIASCVPAGQWDANSQGFYTSQCSVSWTAPSAPERVNLAVMVTNTIAQPPLIDWLAVNDIVPQSITFNKSLTGRVGDVISLSASGGQSDQPVTFSSTTPAVCSTGGENGAQLTLKAASSCEVVASQAGTDSYEAAPQVSRSFGVQKGIQVLSGFLNASLNIGVGGEVELNAGGAGTGAVTYTVVDGGSVCEIVGSNRLRANAVGQCVVRAVKAADDNYESATASMPVSVSRGSQKPLMLQLPGQITYGTPVTMSVTGGSGTGEVQYILFRGTACEIAGNQITGIAAGQSCEVYADKAPDGSFERAFSSVVTVTVLKAPQTSLVFTPKSPIVFGEEITLSASGGNGAGAVTFAVVAGGAYCALSGNTLTAIAADGSCTVRASKAGDPNYEGASAEAVINVSPRREQAELRVVAGPLSFPGSLTLSVTGGTTNGPVTYELLSGSCTLSGAVLSSTGVGTCRVRASIAGSGGFLAVVSAPLDVTVSRNLVTEEAARRLQQQMLSTSQSNLSFNPVADRMSAGQRSRTSVSFLPQGDSGQGSIAFATSLQQITNAAGKGDRQVVPTAAERTDAPTAFMPRAAGSMDLWADGRFVWLGGEDGGGRRNGFIGEMGLDYLVSGELLVGLSVRFDGASGGGADSQGWMAGPYAVAEVAPGLRVDGRLLWGRREGETDVVVGGLSYSGDYRSERWLAEAGARGEIGLASLTIEPGLRISWWRELTGGYSLGGGGGTVDDQELTLLRVSLDPRFSFLMEGSGGLAVNPYIKPQLIAEWRDQTGRDEGQHVFGALEAGFSVSGPSLYFGARIGATGLGADEGHDYSAGANLTIPLN